MSLTSLLLNLLWIVCGGLGMALGWVIAAVVMAITIIGLPWATAAFSIAAYTLLPFGYKAVPRDEHFGREDVGTGLLGTFCATVLSLTVAAAVASAQTPSPSAPAASPVDKQAISKTCSDQANAKGLHGKVRKKFRSECKKRGGAPQ